VCNRPRFFAEAFHLLLCGVGTGFSVQWQHVDCLPELQHVDPTDVRHHVIPDTIEGWADALDALIDSYMRGYYVEFAYHQIRKRGVPLKVTGGRAPGHIPLRRALDAVRRVLDKAQGRQLRPIECYDIMCHAADAVFSGGVREAAMIALFSLDDGEMMQSKTGDWFTANPQRQRSNNSVVLPRASISKTQFQRIFRYTRQYGEPGFVFLTDLDTGYNPCLSGDTRLLTEHGYRTMRELWVDGGEHEWSPNTAVEKYGTQRIINSHGTVTATGVYRTSKCADLLRIALSDGRHVDATPSHTFIRVVDGKQQRCMASELMVGDNVPLLTGQTFGRHHDPEYALLAGWVIGDGSLARRGEQQNAIVRMWNEDVSSVQPVLRSAMLATYDRHNRSSPQAPGFTGHDITMSGFPSMLRREMCSSVLGRLMGEDGCKAGDKHNIPASIWGSDRDTVAAFLRGLLSADGGVECNEEKRCISIRITQAGPERRNLLLGVQLLLRQFGISASVGKARDARVIPMNDGKGGRKLYKAKASNRLIISGLANAKLFIQHIGFIQQSKTDTALAWFKLHRGSYNTGSAVKTHGRIVSISAIGAAETFCLTEFSNNEITVNGIMAGQCVEISLNPKLIITPEVRSQIAKWAKQRGVAAPKVNTGDVLFGWQHCNLTEINAAICKTPEQLYAAARAAAVIGTLQAGYTRFNYLGWVSEFICWRESLLGVSMTGMMDSPSIALDHEVQRAAAQIVIEANEAMADKIGIPTAARCTCVKPAGSTSKVLGGIGAGINVHHARRYFMRIRATPGDPPYEFFKKLNPHMCQRISAEKEVITVPIVAPDGAITRHDVGAVQFLQAVLDTQRNWVMPGVAKPSSSPGTCHNVSNTCTVKDGEWGDVAEFLWDHRDSFSGVSLLSDVGDKVYEHAPREEVTNDADEAKWQMLLRDYKPVDWAQFTEEDDNTDLTGEIACSGGACELT
jgi:hypothetical protein